METNKKQTAVEWLVGQITYSNEYGVVRSSFHEMADLSEFIDQAKQMEREQMIQFAIDMHKIDCSKTGTNILLDEANIHYNKTYGKET